MTFKYFLVKFLFNKEEKVNLRGDLGIGLEGKSKIYLVIEKALKTHK